MKSAIESNVDPNLLEVCIFLSTIPSAISDNPDNEYKI